MAPNQAAGNRAWITAKRLSVPFHHLSWRIRGARSRSRSPYPPSAEDANATRMSGPAPWCGASFRSTRRVPQPRRKPSASLIMPLQDSRFRSQPPPTPHHCGKFRLMYVLIDNKPQRSISVDTVRAVLCG